MKRSYPILLLPVILTVSCLADFDKTIREFTEGPIRFRLEAASLEVPPGFLNTDSGGCEVASIGCGDAPCPEETTICSVEGVCLLEPRTVLSEVVDIGYAYDPGSVRVDSVRVQDPVAFVQASDLNFDIEAVTILWAPVEAPWGAEARPIGTAGPLIAGQPPGVLHVVPDDQGKASLEDWLVQKSSFRVFVELVALLDPGHPCPDGSLDLDIELSFRLTGEPLP